MRREAGQVGRQFRTLSRTARSMLAGILKHPGGTALSVIAAFGIWAFIQDAENPRGQAVVPGETLQPIAVQALNVPDGVLITEKLTVRVKVEAREADIPDLTADDFRATVDARDVAVGGDSVTRPVRVESKRSGVRVIAAQPSNVEFTLEAAETRDVPVTVRTVGDFPAGFRAKAGTSPEVDPAIARISGRSQLVASVRSVELDVNVSSARDESFVAEGELVARTEGGNRVDVAVSPPRARAILRIEQVLGQRTLVVLPLVTGSPAPGYRVTNITVDPPATVVNGPKSVVDGLKALNVEKVDVTGARADLTQTKQLERVPNVVADRQTVVVRVEIRPFECGAQSASPCGAATLYVAPAFENLPAGLTIDGSSMVVVRVSGPLSLLGTVRPTDLRAVVSLEGARSGTFAAEPTVTILGSGFAALRVESVDPLFVKLVPVLPP